MHEKRVEGIVLKAIPFKESDRILSIFTPDRGIISLFVKRISKSRPAMVNLTTPLCRAEFVFRKGRSDLYRFIDGSILDLHLNLRQSYKHLEYGAKMLGAISTSQMPGKAAPSLYLLLLTYLKQLATFPDLPTLWASFQLKLLKHEGLLALEKSCSVCGKEALRIVEGESRCTECVDNLSFPFSKKEWEHLLLLFHAKQFDTFKHLRVDPVLIKGIDALYMSRIAS
jgi:DNA repair protein RecO (recombination protein O)